MLNIGPGELVAIMALALIVLGPQRLPEAVRTVGRVVGELRRISSGFQEELRNALDDSEVERDLDRLRGSGDGRDGRDQQTLPLDDQPELPLGAVQYPSGFEPVDVQPGTTPGTTPGTSGDDATEAPAGDEVGDGAVEPAPPVAGDDDGADDPLGPDAPADEPDEYPAIDVDPAEPWEPPVEGEGNGDGRQVVP
ncbi:MAG TPA: Sec-independent protein translocase protein TatB [Acidimicrobiales bacterium]